MPSVNPTRILAMAIYIEVFLNSLKSSLHQNLMKGGRPGAEECGGSPRQESGRKSSFARSEKKGEGGV
jgi:hypothetical protein